MKNISIANIGRPDSTNDDPSHCNSTEDQDRIHLLSARVRNRHYGIGSRPHVFWAWHLVLRANRPGNHNSPALLYTLDHSFLRAYIYFFGWHVCISVWQETIECQRNSFVSARPRTLAGPGRTGHRQL